MSGILLRLVFKDPKLSPEWVGEGCRILFKDIKEITSGKILLSGIDNEGKEVALIGEVNGKHVFAFSMGEQLQYLLNQEYVIKKKPVLAYLPFHYHKIPFRIGINKLLMKVKKRKLKIIFPNWPADVSVDVLKHIENVLASKKRKSFWKRGKKFAVVLSHDIDTEEGLLSVHKFLELEEKYNFKSTNFVVGNYYKLKEEVLQFIVKEGHEIACHGDTHDALLPYLSEENIQKRLDKCRGFFKKYGVVGFRAPSLLISEKLDKNLSTYFKYDSSVTDTELFMPDSEVSGSCTVFPFFKKDVLRIPITLPMDSSLLFLGYNEDQVLELWKKKFDFIKKIGGVAMIVTHAEKHFSMNETMLVVYEKLLKLLSEEKDAWIVTGKELYEYVKAEGKNVTKID